MEAQWEGKKFRERTALAHPHKLVLKYIGADEIKRITILLDKSCWDKIFFFFPKPML